MADLFLNNSVKRHYDDINILSVIVYSVYHNFLAAKAVDVALLSSYWGLAMSGNGQLGI